MEWATESPDHGDGGLLPAGLGPLWAAYYAIVLFAVTMQLLSIAAMACSGVAACRRRLRSGRLRTIQSPVAAVVPCYLPNEAPIIQDTIRHLLDTLTHLDALDVYVVYNTPKDMPLEAELRAMCSGFNPKRRLTVQRVPGSHSKAENLNHILPQITAKYVAIYDADHQPDPESLALAVARLEDMGKDCVQGSTYIREGQCLARSLVHAEFFVTYFVVLPMMQVIAGTGFFGGANAVWLTSSLQGLSFDTEALTEDIDIFVRATVKHGLTFEFFPECRSGELLPASLQALWKQRLRWAMGWDQVTVRHAAEFWGADLPLQRRFGLYYIFVLRWATQFCAAVIVLFNTQASLRALLAACVGAVDSADTDTGLLLAEAGVPETVPPCIGRLQLLSFYLYAVMITFVLLRGLSQEPRPRLLVGLCMYFVAQPCYICCSSALLVVSLLRVGSGNLGTWVVTSRAGPGGANRDAAGKGGGSPGVPLLQGTQEGVPSLSLWVVAVGLLTQGALIGTVVGAVLGRRKEVRPLWGWVPFGIGAQTVTVIDGKRVVIGFLCGLGVSIVFLLCTWWIVLLRGKSAGSPRGKSARSLTM